MHAHRYGQCLPYRRFIKNMQIRVNLCDVFYEVDVDRVFLPKGRALDSIYILIDFAADASAITDMLQEPCR